MNSQVEQKLHKSAAEVLFCSIRQSQFTTTVTFGAYGSYGARLPKPSIDGWAGLSVLIRRRFINKLSPVRVCQVISSDSGSISHSDLHMLFYIGLVLVVCLSSILFQAMIW